MQATSCGEVEHALEGLDAFGIGVGEGIVEETGETAVVIDSENIRESEADCGGNDCGALGFVAMVHQRALMKNSRSRMAWRAVNFFDLGRDLA